MALYGFGWRLTAEGIQLQPIAMLIEEMGGT
jgi:hypothetical protein